MRTYILRRLILVVPTLFILRIIVFLSVHFIPGDVIDAMVAKTDDPSVVVDREHMERKLGLDKPLYLQYAKWIGGIFLQCTLGQSVFEKWNVEERILDRLPVTLQLGGVAIIIGLMISLPVGIYSAIRQDTVSDYIARTIAIIGLATPNFWLALMVIIFPAIWWGWAPPLEVVPFTEDPLGSLSVFIIPSAILGTAMSASTMRLTRTMMLEVLRQTTSAPRGPMA